MLGVIYFGILAAKHLSIFLSMNLFSSKLSDVGSLIEAKDSVIDKDTRLDIDSYERKIKRLEAEKKEKENIISSKLPT